MKITLLGGGHEIGASSILINSEDGNLLFDSGVKYSSSGNMPSFSLLQDTEPDAIIVTHAHLDHTGTLPILTDSFPDIPVYMTAPTLDLITILLKDSLKIMRSSSEREGEIPLYSEKAVDHLLSRIVILDFGEPFKPAGSSSIVTFHPAGHILGASMAIVETSEGSIVVTGDYSIQDQCTVPGARRPPGRRRVVISESTYGNRLHTDRRIEERRLVRQVADKIQDGGKVLIPAFALGRAQEIILMLAKAMASGDIPGFPIWVDGMVRQVCDAYSRHPSYLNPEPAELLSKGVNPFFGLTPWVQPVRSPEDRQEAVIGPPCCIISSSGMLTGGPSLYYAGELAGNPDNMIAITGYQDEESPGSKLQAISAQNRRSPFLVLDSGKIRVKCSIESYSLSAHADQTEMSAFISSFKPSDVILVHGDDKARNCLADALSNGHVGRIHLPENGDTINLEFAALKGRKKCISNTEYHSESPPIQGPQIKTNEILMKLPQRDEIRQIRDLALDRNLPSAMSIHQLFRIWSETLESKHSAEISDSKNNGRCTDPFIIQAFTRALIESGLFRRDRKYAYLLKPSPAGMESKDIEEPKISILDKVIKHIPENMKLLKKGLDRSNREIVLTFAFPLAAEKILPIMNESIKGTGWKIRMNSGANLGELRAAVARCLEDAGGFAPGTDTKISILNDQARVIIKAEALPPEGILKKASEKFLEMTGFKLSGEKVRKPRPPAGLDSCGKMEINAAYSLADSIFLSSATPPYRKSRKRDSHGEFMELAFITPEVGRMQLHLIQKLEMESGWRIMISQSPNQDALKNLAREIASQEMELKREPSFMAINRSVRLKVRNLPDHGLASRLNDEFRKMTGFNLEFTV
ncbi:MAG: hypothetical protein CVV64_10750 [Candidatus Wallbacteria bacterium HGW-Wallbacteria-1]|jgi:predicted metal-dependent RNase|uniref:MBL fold metallo-hydrolase n=1 Tax=Candidatus Wallbacteria bacterium HGW-Wallbacteria-1 TaxID=2013854 RepID=A0A2N1PPD8_9BACT|nr:MAG: hypothetical protein CVV64_10750 [Candidatus Wallbacteria bacterium HGW-Wallbacteria-1]